MPNRPISPAETHGLLDAFLRLQGQRHPVPLAEPTLEQLALHLQAEGVRQGMVISDIDARVCAQQVHPVVPTPAEKTTIATQVPAWPRPRHARHLERLRAQMLRWHRLATQLTFPSPRLCTQALVGTGLVLWGLCAWAFHSHLTGVTAASHGASSPWAIALLGAGMLTLLLGGALIEVFEVHRPIRRIITRSSHQALSWLQGRLNGLEVWTPSETELQRWRPYPSLVAQIQGLLDSDCPTLRRDRDALTAQYDQLVAAEKQVAQKARIRAQLHPIGSEVS